MNIFDISISQLMKHLFIMILMSLFVAVLHAQNATIVAAQCPQCGIVLHGADMKKFDDPSFHKSGCTFVKKRETESNKLRDYTPMQEVGSKYSEADQRRLYSYGNGTACPICGGISRHNGSDCALGYAQKRAMELREEAERASNADARRNAVRNYQMMEENINTLAQSAQKSGNASSPAPSTTQPKPWNPIENIRNNRTHITNALLEKGYDKKLAFYDSYYACAFGKTSPNGEEEWVLVDRDGDTVGTFSKIELADDGSFFKYYMVRDFNGQWGLYNERGTLLCAPKYESINMLTANRDDYVKEAFFDVTQRDGNGVLRHGVFNQSYGVDGIKGEVIPCACDHIELIDRSPSSRGTLAKFQIGGAMGVMNVQKGEVLIQPSYSYINTYFTLKHGMFLIVGDSNGLGAFHAASMKEVVPVTPGYTLDKVRNLIDQIGK